MFFAYERWIKSRSQGGDRKIGAGLGELLSKHNFKDVKVKKELFSFDKADFEKVVLAIFPPIKDQMVADGIMDEETYHDKMAYLESSQTKLESLNLPLYYCTATK